MFNVPMLYIPVENTVPVHGVVDAQPVSCHGYVVAVHLQSCGTRADAGPCADAKQSKAPGVGVR